MTTESTATNPHQPQQTENRLTCTAPDCGYAMFTYGLRHFEGQPEKQDTYWRSLFTNHADQFDPGRAPDITVDWEISACCSVCEDKIGHVETNDSESVICKECGTTWHIDGTGGELKEQE
jgi:hypothetical protein